VVYTESQRFTKTGQAGTIVLERLTELEHTAAARMDAREWLVQKANILNKLDRLVQ
jgi:hypothetical protein